MLLPSTSRAAHNQLIQRIASATADQPVVARHFAPATTGCEFHPLAVRREAPHNQRIHLTKSVHDPFGLIPRFAGDPQPVMHVNT